MLVTSETRTVAQPVIHRGRSVNGAGGRNRSFSSSDNIEAPEGSFFVAARRERIAANPLFMNPFQHRYHQRRHTYADNIKTQFPDPGASAELTCDREEWGKFPPFGPRERRAAWLAHQLIRGWPIRPLPGHTAEGIDTRRTAMPEDYQRGPIEEALKALWRPVVASRPFLNLCDVPQVGDYIYNRRAPAKIDLVIDVQPTWDKEFCLDRVETIAPCSSIIGSAGKLGPASGEFKYFGVATVEDGLIGGTYYKDYEAYIPLTGGAIMPNTDPNDGLTKHCIELLLWGRTSKPKIVGIDDRDFLHQCDQPDADTWLKWMEIHAGRQLWEIAMRRTIYQEGVMSAANRFGAYHP